MRLLKDRQICCVLDCGANEGQFGRYLRERLEYEGEIISFEPLPSAFEKLRHSSACDSRWRVFQYALGDEDTTAVLNISRNSQSSSLLDMEETHLQAAPQSEYVSSTIVKVRRLDLITEVSASLSKSTMLKIDAQGYESKILMGAGDALEQFGMLYLELSLVNLYSGEAMIEEVIAMLRGRGFKPVSINFGYIDESSWEQLQADVIFVPIKVT